MTDNHHAHASHDHHDHAHPSHHHAGHNQEHTHPVDSKTLLGPSNAELAECPVMKGSIVVKAEAEAEGLYRDYEGTRYWFCCAGCLPDFDADPARYTAA